jgi:hypothetical protein
LIDGFICDRKRKAVADHSQGPPLAWLTIALINQNDDIGSKPNQALDSATQIMIRAGQDPFGGDDGEPVLAF